MKIESERGIDTIEIRAFHSGLDKKFSVSALIGKGRMKDDDLSFANAKEFLNDLQALTNGQSAQAMLKGDRHFELRVEAERAPGAAWVWVKLHRPIFDRKKGPVKQHEGQHSLEGGFRISRKQLENMIDGFQNLIGS